MTEEFDLEELQEHDENAERQWLAIDGEKEKQLKVDDAVSNLEKAQLTIQELEEKVHKYKKKLQREVELQQQEQEKLMENFSQQKVQLQQMLKRKEEEMREERTHYEEQITKLKAEIMNLEQSIEDKNYVNQSRLLREQQGQQSIYRQQLEDNKKRTQQQMQQLRERHEEEIRQMQQDRDDLRKQLVSQREQQQELERTKMMYDHLHQSLINEQEQRQQLKSELEQSRMQSQQVSSKLDEIQRERTKNFTEKIIQTDETSVSLENLAQRQERYDIQIDTLTNELQLLTNKLKDTEAHNERLSKQLEESHNHIIALNTEIRGYVSQLEAIMNENTALRNVINKLQGEVDQIQQNRRTLEKEVKKRNRFISTFVQPILK